MIELKRNCVTEKVIMAMLSRQEGLDMMLDDETWSDEQFMRQGLDPQTKTKPGGSNGSASAPADGGTNIFGSGGGEKGGSKTRSGDGAIDAAAVTAGSGAVKHLRPPT